MIEIIKASFTAGEIKTFLIQGEYLEILECAYPVDVSMMDRSGAQLSTMRSAEASYFSRPGKYEVIQVQSAAAQTVRIFVGSGDAGTRKTSGDVSVVDGGKNRSIAGSSFSCVQFQPASVGMRSAVQMWNPAASGKLMIVQSFDFSVNLASIVSVGYVQAALGALYPIESKRAGAGNPSAKTSVIATASVPAGFKYLAQYQLPDVGSKAVALKEPYVIPPGWGLTFLTGAANCDLNVVCEMLEESV